MSDWKRVALAYHGEDWFAIQPEVLEGREDGHVTDEGQHEPAVERERRRRVHDEQIHLRMH